MVFILTTKKTKPIVVNHVIILSYAALLRRNFAADLFAEKYDNRSQSKGNRIQSNTIERQSDAIEHNQISKVFYFRLALINSIIKIFD